jgi:hypothetical protein
MTRLHRPTGTDQLMRLRFPIRFSQVVATSGEEIYPIVNQKILGLEGEVLMTVNVV